VAWELWESKSKALLTRGLSLDLITTPERAGIGIAKDLYKGNTLELDIGGYLTRGYRERGLRTGVGVNLRF